MDVAALLAWFRANARVLPWRREPRDPYGVWVSEVMLQQTRVDTVLRYYEPFLARFPDVATLAAAPEDALMKAWEGLGYYRRARLLQQGARAVVERHGGALPRSVDALRELPGFGPYTAGAVGSLAFGLRGAAVDGNVLRVWSRFTANGVDVSLPAARAAAEKWVLARQPHDAAGPFNEALMEFGATVCTPRAPRCDWCPVRAGCRAAAEGRAEALPMKARAAAAPTVRVAVAFAERGGRVLLEKRERGLLAGTWGLPWIEVEEGEDAPARLGARVEALTGAPPRFVADAPVARATHVFTHRRWAMEVYEVEAAGAAGEWRDPDGVALGTAHRRVLDAITRRRAPSAPS